MLQGMTQPTRSSPRDLAAAALHTIGDMIRLEQLPIPTSIDVWTHHVKAVDLLRWADRQQAKIHLHGDELAWIVVPLATDTFGITMQMHVLMSKPTKSDQMIFVSHNASCLKSAAEIDAEITAPAGSAHGAPDLRP